MRVPRFSMRVPYSMGKKIVFFNKWCWHNRIAICKRMKVDPYFTSYKKLTHWIKELNVRTKTIKLLDENTEVNLHYLKFVWRFLDATPKAWAKKKKLDTLDFIKIKSLCFSNGKIRKLKKQNGRKYSQIVYPLMDRYTEYYIGCL